MAQAPLTVHLHPLVGEDIGCAQQDAHMEELLNEQRALNAQLKKERAELKRKQQELDRQLAKVQSPIAGADDDEFVGYDLFDLAAMGLPKAANEEGLFALQASYVVNRAHQRLNNLNRPVAQQTLDASIDRTINKIVLHFGKRIQADEQVAAALTAGLQAHYQLLDQYSVHRFQAALKKRQLKRLVAAKTPNTAEIEATQALIDEHTKEAAEALAQLQGDNKQKLGSLISKTVGLGDLTAERYTKMVSHFELYVDYAVGHYISKKRGGLMPMSKRSFSRKPARAYREASALFGRELDIRLRAYTPK